jgi:hypothetical protein
MPDVSRHEAEIIYGKSINVNRGLFLKTKMKPQLGTKDSFSAKRLNEYERQNFIIYTKKRI